MPIDCPDKTFVPRRAYAMWLMVGGSVLISFTGLVIRNMEAATALHINFYRATAFFIAVFLVMLQRYRSDTGRRIMQVGRPGLLAGGFLAAAGMCLLQAITNTTVAATLFICSAIPFITAALAWLFLRERLQKPTLITMCVAALGVCVMISGGAGSGSIYGNLLALMTALCFSGFAIVVRRHRDVEMLPALLISGAIIVVVTLPSLWGQLAVPWRDVMWCFVLGGFISALPNVLFITAARHLVAAELTLFMLLEFALGPVWVWLFINEVPALWTVIGGALVITSVLFRVVFELHQNRQRQP